MPEKEPHQIWEPHYVEEGHGAPMRMGIKSRTYAQAHGGDPGPVVFPINRPSNGVDKATSRPVKIKNFTRSGYR